MKFVIRFLILLLAVTVTSSSNVHADAIDDYVGRWALTLPSGSAGWLSVSKEKDYYDSSILWGGGSVVPTASTYLDDHGTLVITRIHIQERKDENGKVIKTHTFTEIIYGHVDGDTINLNRINPKRNGKGARVERFSGKRIADLPPAPDVSNAKYDEPINLLKANSLDGWELLGDQANGWTVKEGVLNNNPVQPEGKHIRYGNLRTVAEFEDFKLTLETNVPEGGNSGIYLRGIYEVQVFDSYGKSVDSHNMGGIYSRITPSSSAEKPAGQWQSYDITLLDRHVTVILNGTTIIDNQPLLGCTGGALTSDEFIPGPIYLQGDHSGVNYRNIVLTPIIKN